MKILAETTGKGDSICHQMSPKRRGRGFDFVGTESNLLGNLGQVAPPLILICLIGEASHREHAIWWEILLDNSLPVVRSCACLTCTCMYY